MGRAWIPWLALLLVVFGGCSKDKKPRYTAVAIMGYPFPFGIDARTLMGRDRWEPVPMNCPNYNAYRLVHPPAGSRWSEYGFVQVVADSAGKLQGFSASRAFKTAVEADSALLEIKGEIRRRYGSPTDSSALSRTVILGVKWADTMGSSVTVENTINSPNETQRRQWMIHSTSGKLRRECPQPASSD